MRPEHPHENPYPWEQYVGGSYRHGLVAIVAAAKADLALAEVSFIEWDQDTAASVASVVAIDRLLLAVSEEAHASGMCLLCLLAEVHRAYYYAGEFVFPDDEVEVERIAREDARPCDCPAAEALPLVRKTLLSLRGATQCEWTQGTTDNVTHTRPSDKAQSGRPSQGRLVMTEGTGTSEPPKFGPNSILLDNSQPPLRPCPWCDSEVGYLEPAKPPHGLGVRCAGCQRHLGWLSKTWSGFGQP